MQTSSSRSLPGRAALSALLALTVGLALPSLAPAQENPRGAELLREIEDGQRNCDDLQDADFEAMGDSVMGRMVGSSQAHGSMDALMRSMMGRSGGQQMHAALGERFSGCGEGRLPAGTAGMMNGVGGMMGMMGMMGGGLGPGSGSDQGSDQDYGSGSMMGGFGGDRTEYDDNDDHVGAGWMIVMMILLIGGVAAVVYVVTRPRRGGSAPAQLLAERFAHGEIDAEEYEQRRALLGGSR